MATYKEIQGYVKGTYGFLPKTCWIAHMKELCGIPVNNAPNRISPPHREKPCPPSSARELPRGRLGHERQYLTGRQTPQQHPQAGLPPCGLSVRATMWIFPLFPSLSSHKQPMNAEKRRDLRVTPFSATK